MQPRGGDSVARGHAYDRDTPVLILKMEASPLHHGTLGVIRSLGRLGVPVYCSTETCSAPAAKSRYLSKPSFAVLSPRDPAQSLDALKAFQCAIGRPMVVIPVDDKGAMFLAENADVLRPHFLLPSQRSDLLRRAASKTGHAELCREVGAQTPATFVVREPADLEAASQIYPAVVKIAQPWLLPPNILPVFLAKNKEDVLFYYLGVKKISDADIIVQEYIPDGSAEDWFYHAYYDASGAPAVAFTGRKFRSYPPFLGATSYGVSVINHEVTAIAEKVLRGIGYAGIVELEFRFDRRDGRYKFIDFNPRLGAQFQFLRNQSGIDVVRAAHLSLTGRPVPVAKQVEHTAFVSDFTDLAAFAPYWRHGQVGAGEWLLQFLGARERAWFAWDDVGPFVDACGPWAKRFVSATRRRARRNAARLRAAGPAKPVNG